MNTIAREKENICDTFAMDKVGIGLINTTQTVKVALSRVLYYKKTLYLNRRKTKLQRERKNIR